MSTADRARMARKLSEREEDTEQRMHSVADVLPDPERVHERADRLTDQARAHQRRADQLEQDA